jgi:hypothetical protein
MAGMRLWFDWLEYLGADAIGRAIGLWLRFCLSLVKSGFRFLTGTARNPIDSATQISNPDGVAPFDRSQRGYLSPLRKIYGIAISTAVTLVVWRIVTLKTVWLAAGASGDRILAALLLFVSASWVISLIWICFSKSESKNIRPIAQPLRKPICTGSCGTKAN